jgi:hypothetical protein
MEREGKRKGCTAECYQKKEVFIPSGSWKAARVYKNFSVFIGRDKIYLYIPFANVSPAGGLPCLRFSRLNRDHTPATL